MLEAVGLTPDGEAAYLALLDQSAQTRNGVTELLGWPRQRVDGVLDQLVRLGLISAVPGRPARYAAIAPDIAVAALSERAIQEARRVQQGLPTLMERYWRGEHDARPADFIEIISGSPSVVTERSGQLMAAASKLIRALDRPPYPGNVHRTNALELQRLEQGVEVRAIYDQVVVDTPERWPDLEVSLASGEQARVLAGLPTRLGLVDDWVASMPIVNLAGEYAATLVIHRSPLLTALSELFEFYWARATPLAPTWRSAPQRSAPEPGTSDAPEVTRQDRLITLLSAGLTDAAIARTLGISRSTLQRSIRELLGSLGVQTRFQAGLQLARRAP